MFECFKSEPARPSKSELGNKSAWIPFAKIMSVKMSTKGKYAKGYPVGAVVHFTAGGHDMDGTMKYGVKQGFAYLGIGRKGEIFQAHPMNEWGHHAGDSAWKGLGSGVSSKLVGIEIAAAGRVSKIGEGKYKTWFGSILGEDDVRHSKADDNIQAGIYEKYSPEQEEALINLLLWMKRQAPDVFSFDFVLGHDEVAGPKGIGRARKNDPGGALSMTMSQFRQLLKDRWNEELKQAA